MSVNELINNIATILQVQDGLVNKVILSGPSKIQILLTDDLLRQQPVESAFYFQLVHEQGSESYTILLEPVAPEQD